MSWSKPFIDDDIMPFGKYKGMRMIEIPDDYLIWLYKNTELHEGGIKAYIEENFNENELTDGE